MKTKIIIVSILLIIFVSSFSVFAQNSIIVETLSFGIMTNLETIEEFESTSAPSGTNIFSKPGKFTKAEIIPLKLGVAFGFEYLLKGFQGSEEVKLTHLIEHPRIVNASGVIFDQQENTFLHTPVNGEIQFTDGYEFSEEYELVEGEWTFTVILKGQPLVQKSFLVVKD